MTDSPRLGSIAFINSLPVDLGILSGEVPTDARVVREAPASLNALMGESGLDVSPVSAFWFALNARDLYLLPDLSVSSESGVKSVLLFHRRPLPELGSSRILVTAKGRTTPALLEIICRLRYGFRPQTEVSARALEDVAAGRADAALVIGDEALVAREAAGGLTVTDLAEEWNAWTGFPVVFAVWAVRRTYFAMEPGRVRALQNALRASRAWGMANPEAILDRAEKDSGLPRPTLEGYFRSLTYGFDDPLRRGLDYYLHCAARCGLLPGVPEIETLPAGAALAESV